MRYPSPFQTAVAAPHPPAHTAVPPAPLWIHVGSEGGGTLVPPEMSQRIRGDRVADIAYLRMTARDLPSNPAANEARSRSGRPKLLFLAQTLPYPPDGGVQIRTYNVLRLLAREFDVTALCFYRSGLVPTAARVAASVAHLRKMVELEEFPIPQEHNRWRLLRDHVKSVAIRRAYTVTAYESAAYRKRLTELLATRQFDLVHVDSLDLSGYLPALGELPVVCVHHNVESALLRSRAKTFATPVRFYLNHQADLIEREERRFLPGVRLNIAVSGDDAAALTRLVPAAQVVVVPNGVDTNTFSPADTPDANGLVFVGGHSWQPNRDAMSYFSNEILPLLRELGTDPPVTWVGSATPKAMKEYAEKYRVHLTGYVADIRPFVNQAACYIAPLRAGGGTRLKILDAWAMGKAVVSTTVGCEGLEARDGENILIRDSPGAFAAAVKEILDDASLRQTIALGARETAERLYDWEVIGRTMIQHYHSLLPPPPPTSAA